MVIQSRVELSFCRAPILWLSSFSTSIAPFNFYWPCQFCGYLEILSFLTSLWTSVSCWPLPKLGGQLFHRFRQNKCRIFYWILIFIVYFWLKPFGSVFQVDNLEVRMGLPNSDLTHPFLSLFWVKRRATKCFLCAYLPSLFAHYVIILV